MYITDKATAGIQGVMAGADGLAAPVCNLRGQRFAAPQKGINITNGRKVVVR